jgi:hypothetical protein
MVRRARLSVLCIVFAGIGVGTGPALALGALDDPVLGLLMRDDGPSGRVWGECPAGVICGQEAGACGASQWFFYSDLEFCNPAPTTCQRVRCDNFPPPGVTITQPIASVTWYGVYIDDTGSGCTKPQHQFRIQFYQDEGGAPQFPPFYTENVIATAEEGPWYYFCFVCNPTPVLRLTAVLANPVPLASGWFSIAGYGTPGCYHLWQGSDQGDNKYYGWWEEGGTIPGPAVTNQCDLAYCLGPWTAGACCLDCGPECFENVAQSYCEALGGRYGEGLTCGQMSPPCGAPTGACCYDDGTCDITTCSVCEGPPACHGDANCDGTINFGDINPFVLALTNIFTWREMFLPIPGCTEANCDINLDGTINFGDINPFVALMVQCGTGCPCPDGTGGTWAGPGTTCSDACCVALLSRSWLDAKPVAWPT